MSLSHITYLTLAMVLAGSSVIVNKMITASFPPFVSSCISLAIALPILLLIRLFTKETLSPVSKHTWGIIALQAFCGIVCFRVFTLFALYLIPTSLVGLITSCTSGFIGLFSIIVLKKTPPKRHWCGIILSMFALLLLGGFSLVTLSGQLDKILLGILLTLLAVMGEALFSTLSKLIDLPPITHTTFVNVFALMFLSPFALWQGIQMDWSLLTLSSLFPLLYYSIFVCVLSYYFWFKGIAKVSAAQAAPFSAWLPITTIFLSSFLLHEKLMLHHFIGLSLILLSIYYVSTDRSAILA